MIIQTKKELKALIQKKGNQTFPNAFPDAFDFDEGDMFKPQQQSKANPENIIQKQDDTSATKKNEKQNTGQSQDKNIGEKPKYTVYIYRLTKNTDSSYTIGNNDITDKILKSTIAPSIARIMNHNWLDAQTEVKAITQSEAEKFTAFGLAESNSAILPIVRSRYPNPNRSDSIGISNIYESTGYTDPDPEYTYLNLARIQSSAKTLGLTTNYFLAYVGAHEALHQLHAIALSKLGKWDPKKYGHSFGLNEDGQQVSAEDFKNPIPKGLDYLDLKSMAEWIPFTMKQDLNAAIKK